MKKINSRSFRIGLRAATAIFSCFLLQASGAFAQGSVIVLYGCSSAGKTSISQELGKILPGKWKVLGIDMFSNKDNTANALFWKQANKELSAGYNVVLDTVFPSFLLDRSKGYELFTVLTYCSPKALVEHVSRRNMNGKDHDHRTLKKVLQQYCNKYRGAISKDYSVDVIERSEVKNIGDWRARKKIKEEFFKDDRHVAYIVSKFYEYDAFVNSGKMSISACAKKIREDFETFQKKDQA